MLINKKIENYKITNTMKQHNIISDNYKFKNLNLLQQRREKDEQKNYEYG